MRSNLTSAYARYVNHADANSLNGLYSAVSDYARVIAQRRKLNLADASDVAQETAITVWQRLATFDSSKSSFRTWVHRCTLDRLVDYLRKQARLNRAAQVTNTDESATNDINPAYIASIRAIAGDAEELMDLVLALGDVASAAEALGITTRAAQQRLRRIAPNYFAATERNRSGLDG